MKVGVIESQDTQEDIVLLKYYTDFASLVFSSYSISYHSIRYQKALT